MSATEEPAEINLEQAREMLLDMVREWRADSRLTTTAGLKSALVRTTGGQFDEKRWGYRTFRDFLTELAAGGWVELSQLPTNHWLVLLPGEVQEDVLAERNRREHESPSHGQVSTREAEPVRLKSEVWLASVTWLDHHRRLWDRVARRPFAYPIDDDGAPAFLTELDRFVEIPAADVRLQRQWMRTWAGDLPEAARAQILAALDSTAPGEFRRSIERLDLTTAWRSELHRRVAELLLDWADSSGVPKAELVDTRNRRPKPSVGATSSDRLEVKQDSTVVPSGSVADELRARLHQIIDSMSLQELASLPIPAAYLLDD